MLLREIGLQLGQVEVNALNLGHEVLHDISFKGTGETLLGDHDADLFPSLFKLSEGCSSCKLHIEKLGIKWQVASPDVKVDDPILKGLEPYLRSLMLLENMQELATCRIKSIQLLEVISQEFEVFNEISRLVELLSPDQLFVIFQVLRFQGLLLSDSPRGSVEHV